MKITIDSVIRLKDVPADVLKKIKSELTLKNPEYIKKMRMGLNRYTWGPEFIKLWSEKMVDGSTEYILPRGYFQRLWNLVGLSWENINDRRLKLPEVEFLSRPQLRDYQSPAVELAKGWQQGVVIMPCGAGKTCSAMGIVADIGQPVLWITHTMDLLNQSMEAAMRFLGLSGEQIGIIQGENMSIGTHMTFATVQTLSKRDLTEIKNKFGCIVIDEAHLTFKNDKAACMFESVISQFSAYYRFGLTASEHRSDGLIDSMFHIIGPKFYEVEQDDPRLPVMKPIVEFIETDFLYEVEEDEDGEKEMLNVQTMLKAMREDFDRQSIVQGVLDKVQMGDYCLVLGDSLEHLEAMYKYVRLRGYNAGFVNGSTKKAEREKTLKNMRDGKMQFLFATYQLAKLGLDIPRLNVLVLASPKKDKTSIQQSVGRIMRPEEGKSTPVVYDIWDSKVRSCQFWGRERAKVYRSLGCEVVGGPKIRGGRR